MERRCAHRREQLCGNIQHVREGDDRRNTHRRCAEQRRTDVEGATTDITWSFPQQRRVPMTPTTVEPDTVRVATVDAPTKPMLARTYVTDQTDRSLPHPCSVEKWVTISTVAVKWGFVKGALKIRNVAGSAALRMPFEQLSVRCSSSVRGPRPVHCLLLPIRTHLLQRISIVSGPWDGGCRHRLHDEQPMSSTRSGMLSWPWMWCWIDVPGDTALLSLAY